MRRWVVVADWPPPAGGDGRRRPRARCRAHVALALRAGMAAVALVAAQALAVAGARAGPLDDAEVRAALGVLDAWIERTVAERNQPAVSIGIVHDQDLVWARGYGYADVARRIPATPATVYRIASITKVFTATAVLQLRDEGRLQLDDPLARHLSWFTLADDHPDSPPITIRHVLTHTSGMPRELDLLYWDDLEFPADADMPRLLAGTRTVLPRETKYKYSNLAIGLLGSVISAVSGETYGDYMHRHVFAPLGMTASWVAPPRDRGALATGYRAPGPDRRRAVAPFLDLRGRSAAGNGASSVEDLARFLSLQFRDGPRGGAQVLRGATLREMQRVHWLQPDWQSGRGLGWSVTRVGGQTRIGHTGSVPGYRSSIAAVTADRIAVIVLTNADDGRPADYAEKAWSMVVPALKRATAPAAAATPTADPSWSRYLGAYQRTTGDAVRVVLAGEELAIVTLASDDPWNTRIRLAPVAPDVFRMVDGYQEGELVRFESDGGGRIVRFRMPGYSFVRQ